MTTANQNKQQHDEVQTFDFEQFFDKVITNGVVTKTVTVADGLSVDLHPLDAQEQLLAELTVFANEEGIPKDTINRIRVLQILSRAIISVNGIPVLKEDKAAKAALYTKLSALPGVLVDRIFDAYKEVLKEQAALFGKDLVDKIGNF